MVSGPRTCVSFNGDALCDLAAQFMALAEKQGAAGPLMIGHRLMAMLPNLYGRIRDGAQSHIDRAIALYNPTEHRALATRFGQDVGVVILSLRSWLCGFLAILRPR